MEDESKDLHFNIAFSLQDLFETFLKLKAAESEELGNYSPSCPGCGSTWPRIVSLAKVGCEQCYETFRPQLLPLIRKVQDRPEHQGKLPSNWRKKAEGRRALADLRAQMERAVLAEEFEEAAKLRDQIHTLEKGEDDA